MSTALAMVGGLSGFSSGEVAKPAPDPVAVAPGATAAGGEAVNLRATGKDDVVRFAELDVNRDGWLSGSEANGIRHYDRDGDAEITQDEFISGRASERLLLREGTVIPEDIDLFEALDSTGSGYISGVDIERGNVATYDTDANGRVTRQEFYDGRAAFRRELEARAAAAREAAARRRRATGEPDPAPPLGQVLKPKPGMMIGRVLTPDGQPVKEFTIEFVGYNIDLNDPRIDGRGYQDPNLIGRVDGRDGYYEIRLPDGSFGFAASVSIPAEGGARRFPLRTADERQTIDYIEVRRSGEGVVKNMVWDPSSSKIKPGGGE
ncbi:MAG TPA: hypothetical protein VGA56_11170 [Opitutaceae bacterium]